MQKIIISLFLFAIQLKPAQAQTRELGVGDTIPSFSLKDQDGNTFNIREHIGSKIMVIYFYPKDESSVCTKEACGFRDSYGDFTSAGAEVIGINSGTVESHQAFRLHHQLPFVLLSDPGNKVLKRFGVKGKFIFTGRKTFVVDTGGKIVFTYDAFTKGAEHADKALRYIKHTAKN